MKTIEPAVPMQQVEPAEGELKNAILIYADVNGVTHRFTTEQLGKAYLEQAAPRCEAPSMMIFDSILPAEDLLRTSPQMQQRLQRNKDSLQAFMMLKSALDRNGVSLDRVLRGSIHKAVGEMQAGVV